MQLTPLESKTKHRIEHSKKLNPNNFSAKKCIEHSDWSQERIARFFGVSHATVSVLCRKLKVKRTLQPKRDPTSRIVRPKSVKPNRLGNRELLAKECLQKARDGDEFAEMALQIVFRTTLTSQKKRDRF